MKGTISRCIQGHAHDVCSDGHRVYAVRRYSGEVVVTKHRSVKRRVRSWQQVPYGSRTMICARGKNLLTSQRLQLQPAGEGVLGRWLLAEEALERRSDFVLGSGIQRGNKATTLPTHVIAYINPRHIFTSFIESYHRAFPNVKPPQLNSIHHVSPNCKSCFPGRKGRSRKGFRRPCPAERSEERPRVIRMQRCFPQRSGGLTFRRFSSPSCLELLDWRDSISVIQYNL